MKNKRKFVLLHCLLAGNGHKTCQYFGINTFFNSCIQSGNSLTNTITNTADNANATSAADNANAAIAATPSLPWLEANSQSGMDMNKTYNPHFCVPGSMQIVGPTLNGMTKWLPKLIQDAVTYF